MQVIRENTEQILHALDEWIDTSLVEIETRNADSCGHKTNSDYVILEKCNHIGFEVFSNEIRVDYFGNHTHFGRDNTISTEYTQQAIDFLRAIFSRTLVKMETYRGHKQIRYEWFVLSADGRKEWIGSHWNEPLFPFVNPFRRKTHKQTRWSFHRGTGTFVQVDDDTVSVHSYDWDILIEIRQANNVYTYSIHRYFYDEEMAVYYWMPVETPGASLFDTENNALRHAKTAAKGYCATHPNHDMCK